MQFKRKKVYSADPMYDLFDGGYIDPKKLLKDKEDIDRVLNAMQVVREFLDAAEEAGVIEIG